MTSDRTSSPVSGRNETATSARSPGATTNGMVVSNPNTALSAVTSATSTATVPELINSARCTRALPTATGPKSISAGNIVNSGWAAWPRTSTVCSSSSPALVLKVIRPMWYPSTSGTYSKSTSSVSPATNRSMGSESADRKYSPSMFKISTASNEISPPRTCDNDTTNGSLEPTATVPMSAKSGVTT